MDKRKTADRRQNHLFVSEDRRGGPYDRRGQESRSREIEAERGKIEKIRKFKAKDKATSSAAPLFTKKRLVYLGLALVLLVVVLFRII